MNVTFITAALVYVLKVTAVSGLSYGYYRLFLRNRVFHQYNRYYLLGAMLASLLLPLIPLPELYPFPVIMRSPIFDGAVHAITPANWNEPVAAGRVSDVVRPGLSSQGMLGALYLLFAGIVAFAFVRQLRYIRRLPQKYPREKIAGIDFFMTCEPGTPFSFLNLLFWNEEIDMNSVQGRQVFRHEWYHIRQRHTVDLLLLRTVRVLFWANPFFYLIYQELRTIHEFLADRYAVAGGDRYEYAELLVWHSVYDRPPSLLHPFFQSSIKRRITMLTRLTSAKTGYWSRFMALPLAFVLLCAFAVRLRPTRLAATDPSFTVIIDPGHGGMDDGAVAGNEKEKDINLALALKVQQLAPEYHVNVVLTRQTDELAGNKSSIRESLEYRSALANEHKADLFVSIHVNSKGPGAAPSPTPAQGFSAWVSKDNARYPQCVQLGSAMIDAIKGTYATDEALKQVPNRTYVLDHSAMPAVLLECGFLDNPDDRAFISDSRNQEKIARDILQGIQRYEEGQAAGK